MSTLMEQQENNSQESNSDKDTLKVLSLSWEQVEARFQAKKEKERLVNLKTFKRYV